MAGTLLDTLKRVNKGTQRGVLASAFVFPRTATVADTTARICLEQTTLDLDELIHQVTYHPEAVALSARGDLKLVLNACKLLSDEVLLGKFDYLIFRRYGMELLKIRLTTNTCGHSAYVEIDDYRRRLVEATKATPASIPWTCWVTTLGVIGLATVVLLKAHNTQ